MHSTIAYWPPQTKSAYEKALTFLQQHGILHCIIASLHLQMIQGSDDNNNNNYNYNDDDKTV